MYLIPNAESPKVYYFFFGCDSSLKYRLSANFAFIDLLALLDSLQRNFHEKSTSEKVGHPTTEQQL